MKITANINAANTNLSAVKKNNLNSVAPKGKLNISGENVADSEKKDKNNFDDVESISTNNAELVRNLSSLSKEEKAEAAYYSYMDMQTSCKAMIDGLEIKKYCFNSLKEQKAYYSDLLENDGRISEQGGKYEFFGEKEGVIVNRDDIEKALSKVQGHINNYLSEPNEKSQIFNVEEKLFKSAAAVFSTATGITDKALTLEDDSLKKVKGGLTEDNYLERITDDISSIKERSTQLANIMTDYAAKNDLVKDKMNDPFKPINESDKNPHLSKVLEAYREFLESNQLLN